jgi:hypothetical protein
VLGKLSEELSATFASMVFARPPKDTQTSTETSTVRILAYSIADDFGLFRDCACSLFYGLHTAFNLRIWRKFLMQ